MHSVQVRKKIELSGVDDRLLEHRIDILRQALHVHFGSIVDIKWNRQGAQPDHVVSIVYQLPLTHFQKPLRAPPPVAKRDSNAPQR